MERHVLGAALYWLLPFALLAACLSRFNALSLVYLLFLLLLPWFPGPCRHGIPGHTGRLLQALLVFSLLFLAAHLAFQICLHTVPRLDQLLGPSCSPWEILSRHVGITRLDLKDIPNAIRLVAPDLGVLVVSSVCLGLCRRLARDAQPSQRAQELDDDDREVGPGSPVGSQGAPVLAPTRRSRLATRFQITAHWLLVAAGRTLAIVLLALAGIAHPSAFSSVYFLIFLATCTWWACHFPISPLGFSTLCVMVGCFGAGHLICIYCYQTPFAQAMLPPSGIWARVFGLKALVAQSNCSHPNVLVLDTSHDWPVYVSPGVLLLLYYTVTSLLKLRTHQPLDQRKEASGSDEEQEVELTQVDQWPQGQARAAATKEEGAAQCMLPTTTGSDWETDSCTVHDLTGHSPIQQRPVRPGLAEPREPSPLHSLGHLIMDQSYVCALTAMMVWSITYHSWLTFVLLLWACLIWTVRSRHQMAMLCSPFILLYGLALCGLRYVWAMDLRPELPTTLGPVSLRQLGLEHTRYPCLDLGAMLLYTLTFWLLLRRFIKEKLLKAKAPAALTEVTVGDREPPRARTLLQSLGELVGGLYAKYWIYVCAGMFVVVSFAGRLVVYKIVYMLLFLLCLTLFQVYYSLWRKLLKLFWWLVVAYTMLVLVAVYTFQFQDFPTYWRNLTGLTDEHSASRSSSPASSSPASSCLPASCSCTTSTSPSCSSPTWSTCPRPVPASRAGPTGRGQWDPTAAAGGGGGARGGGADERGWPLPGHAGPGSQQVGPGGRAAAGPGLRLLGRPRPRAGVGAVSAGAACLQAGGPVHRVGGPEGGVGAEPAAGGALGLRPALPPLPAHGLLPVHRVDLHHHRVQDALPAQGRQPPRVLQQLHRAPPEQHQPAEGGDQAVLAVPGARRPCQLVWGAEGLPKPRLRPEPPTGPAAAGVRGHRVPAPGTPPPAAPAGPAARSGRLRRRHPPAAGPGPAQLPQICFLMAVNVIGQRMNFMVILHGCWLVLILTRRRRAAIARLWPNYCLFLALFLLYQYLLCLGIPPALCIDYPWRWGQAIPMNSALIKWLYLPDFFRTPNSTNLISDFLLLLCASQQWQVFSAERTEEWQLMAGLNTDHLELQLGEPSAVPNFIYCRSYLDMLKVAVFRYLFWLVLVVVFVTGATRISIFGLGYLLACFYLLLFGTSLLQKHTRTRLVLWDCLILYNVTVIISKNMLSLLSCVFVEQMQSSFCWVIQLFSLVCTVKGYYDPKEMLSRDRDCLLPVEEAGVLWDSVCFLFLLLQRRVFLSRYFLHVRAELQATALQASRGFALYNAANLKSIDLHRKAEEKSLAQLKRQMERIRAKQEKHRQGRAGHSHSQDPPDPTQEPGPGSPGGSSPRRQWWQPWLDHATVIHSGDYFLFESDSEEEEEAVPEDPRPSAQSAFQMAYHAWVTNAQTVLRQQREDQARQEGTEQLPTGGGPGQGAESADGPDEAVAAGPGHVMQRVLSTVQFLWVLGRALLDGLTDWLLAFTRHHRAMSDVLRAERYLCKQGLSGVSVHAPPRQRPGEPRPEPPSVQGREAPRSWAEQRYSSEAEAAPPGPSEAQDAPSTALSGPGAEEPLGTTTEDLGGPLGTGYHTRGSGGGELATEPGASPHSSRELPAGAATRMRTASELLTRQQRIEELEEAAQFEAGQGRVMRLLQAAYQCVAAHSELLCYFIIILNHMVTASATSLVLPVLVFLWAMLSIPRPSKRFWMTAIVFTEVSVVTKYLFQFGFFPWNTHAVLRRYENKPYFPPRILGLEKTDSYIKYDLVQLMALFFHRSQLLCYGLWDHEESQLSKEQDRGSGKKGFEEERAPLGPQTEADMGPQGEPAVAGALTQDHIPAEAGDGPAEPPVELKPRDTKRISLRFRKTRRESTEPVEPASAEGVTAASGREKWSRRPRERVTAVGLRLQSFCLAMARSVYRPLRRFFHDILHTKYRAATDVYALMFLADVVDFIIIIFGFWAFGKHSAATDITSSLSDDQVPEAFLVMLLIQFSTMVIDRALYLRKTVLGKLAFQVVLVLAIHLWMFFILPAVTERMFSQNAVAQLWYFVKCIYFALSAYQIRCGYPTRILGNFLTKKYNHLNLFLFQGFRLVPFLVELRAVMDWVWTDTTLSLSSWMCVEDIYANIFIIKCSRETEKKYPQPKGQKKKKIVKYGMGGLIILFLVAIIWFPLLFMSLVRSVVGVVNQPIDVTVTLKLGGYEPLFTMSAQQPSIVPFTQQAYEELSRHFDPNPLAMQFISQYSPEDIVTAQIEGSSGALWRISPPSRAQMKRELYNGTADITLRFTWNFQRDLAKGGTVEYTNEKHTLDLAPNSSERRQLASLLEGTSDQSVVIRNLFPKYIRAPNGPEANPVKQLQPNEEEDYLSVRIQLRRERVGAGAAGFLEWWVIELQDCQAECNLLPMVIFSDKVSPPSLGFLAGYGIMGLYVSIVLVIGKFVRSFFSEISHSIMFEELPCVDRILKLCQDIFLVRETRELELEEELYAKLIFLYRSPETMIKWTREKE
ncbi:piezo-type mechanosensitive ion channel component 1 isoform X6 [Halichoerus grypus]